MGCSPGIPLRLPAYAKLNLSLLVGPKRDDGFHEISTVMAKISLCDWLHFSLAPEGTIEVSSSDPALPCDERNTVFRTALLLLERFPSRCPGVKIHIHKHIPWGAGLGGGSSDAATALVALNRLWDLELSTEELSGLGSMIGSDVPFFFVPSAAVVSGRGERVSPFPNGLGGYPLVVYPGVEVSTSWAYGAINPRLTLDRTITNIAALSCKGGDLNALARSARNDFEPVVFDKHPVLREVVEELRARGAVFAAMSGSGSSLFGVFEGEEARESARLWAEQRGFSAWSVRWIGDGV